MRITFAALLCLFSLLAIPAHATDITVKCTAPTKFTDGTAITSPVTFNLYGALQGQIKKLLAPSPLSTCSSVRSNVNAGTQCYQVTAVVGGSESDPTAESCITIAAEPVCPPQPAPETIPQTCTAPLVGSWSQTRTYTSVAAPACWQAGAWLPTEAPAGVCAAPPQLLVSGPYAYCLTGTATAPSMTSIGYAPAGLACSATTKTVGSVKFCEIPKEQADKVIFCNGDPTLSKGVWGKVAP
jgi:hypothetical protein